MTARRSHSRRWAWGISVVAALGTAVALAQDVPMPDDGPGWIYEDIEAGYAKAKETGKPLLVAFR